MAVAASLLIITFLVIVSTRRVLFDQHSMDHQKNLMPIDISANIWLAAAILILWLTLEFNQQEKNRNWVHGAMVERNRKPPTGCDSFM